MLNHSQFAQLLPLYLQERAAHRPLVLATLINTQGSSYRKAGAQMLFTHNGEQLGLLSGGCLESDLREHALQMFADELPRRVHYDLRNPDDELFGMGAGCLGALDIFLQVVSDKNDWQPLTQMHARWQAHLDTRLGIVIQSHNAALPSGSILLDAQHGITAAGNTLQPDAELRQRYVSAPANSLLNMADGRQIFVLEALTPPHILILGGGIDARPLAQLIRFMGWHCTVYDHRAAYADPLHFPTAERVIHAPAARLHHHLPLSGFQAAVVMSHHLTSDLDYLRQLANTNIPYIGLLGPPQRRQRLLARLDTEQPLLQPRLHAPVGLNIGAATPEAIALSIIAEMQQTLGSVNQRAD